MTRTILIVDDNLTNRLLLKKMMADDYAILEAAGGEEALGILAARHESISAVLLDISMPDVDGYEVLSRMRSDKLLSPIPVIMVTASEDKETRVKSLALGANDFVMKPYSYEILKHCLQNNIAFREAASTVSAMQRDKLTGLYSRESFFEKVREMALAHEAGYYVMASFDIEKFKVINEQYGMQKGDEVLQHTADSFREGFEPFGGICCRIFADNFAVFYPTFFKDTPEIEAIRNKASHVDGLISPIQFCIGRYIADDVSISPAAMYDRAVLAAATVKGRYDEKIALYNDSLRAHLMYEQEIVSEMESALRNGQFEVWYQPQYNHSTGAGIGAEALVRWRHPVKGLIPPNDFIRIFERNGFIYPLDRFVWEEVCRCLRKWIDAGVSLLPISVNISRYDIFRADMIDVLKGLVDQYRLPIDLLRLEITESAFTESPQRIVEVVKGLLKCGFTVEIDDFGSGYSSLNILKDVPAQVLKLDMKFLESSEDSQRGGNIVESVVRMAKWLGMSVIAEGVESLEQADYLRSIGCCYMQGYLFARPMPVGKYEEHCSGNGKGERLLTLETVENLDNNLFWDPKSMDTLIFNSYIGGACIYEYHNGSIELLRATEKYTQIVGSAGMTVEDALKLNWAEHLEAESYRRVTRDLEESIATKKEVTGEYIFLDLPNCPHKTYLRSTMRVIATAGARYLVYCTNENVTAQRQAEQASQAAAAQRQNRTDASPSPVNPAGMTYQQTLPLLLSAIMEASNDFAFAKDRDFRYICCSPAFLKIAGLEDESSVIGKTDFDLFPADMAEQFRKNDRALFESGKPMVDFDETIHDPDGTVHYCLASKHILRDAAGASIGIYGISRDVTKVRDAFEQLHLVNDSIPGGIATYAVKGGKISIEYCNDGFCKLFGGAGEGLGRREYFDPLDFVLEEDRVSLVSQIHALVEEGVPLDAVFRIHMLGSGVKWINEKAITSERRGDTVLFNAILLDITKQRDDNERLRISEEESNLAVQHGGSIVCRYNVAERSLTISPDAAAAHSIAEKLADVPYEPVRAGLISSESTDAYIGFYEAIINGSAAGTVLYQQRCTGGWRWIEAKSSTIFSDEGKPVKAVISLFDVTERLEKETIYKKWQHSLEDRAPASYTLFRCNLNKNTSYETKEGTLFVFDGGSAEAGFNQCAKAYADECVHSDDRDRYIAFLNSDTMLASYYRGKRSDTLEYRELLRDGAERWLRLSVDLVEYPNSSDVEAYLMYENIDEAKKTELQTKQLSETDPLTGILNRAAFAEKVNRILSASAPGTKHALLMLDIDGFKQVNDVFGHAAGDHTLIELASGMCSIMRSGDLVGRLGGDEFVVFMVNIQDDNAAIAKAKQIRSIARKSFSLEIQIAASIGIARSPHDGIDFDTLYKKADSALYYVKGSGKDNQAVYADNMADEHLAPEPDTFEADSTKPSEKKRRMLIVDDSSVDHALLETMFSDEFIIENTQDGASALIRLRHYGSAISIVLLDLMMPGMDGFAVLEKIQESLELRSVPVIIVSGDESRETCLAAIRKGATDFITKPIDADLLRIRVRSAVSKAENERLRAKNCLLEMQNRESQFFEAFLESPGMAFIEYNRLTGQFRYYPSVSASLAGTYNDRTLWQILLSDMAADSKTVRDMQRLVHRIAESRNEASGSMRAILKTPQRQEHCFRFDVRKLANDYQLTNRLILSLVDMDYEMPT